MLMIIYADHLTSLQYKRYMALKGPISAEEPCVCKVKFKRYTCQHVCIGSQAVINGSSKMIHFCCNDRQQFDRNVKNKQNLSHLPGLFGPLF